MTSLRRLSLLVVLVPQLLVLGLVTGACFCLDGEGDTHLRLVAEACCEAPASAAFATQPGASDGAAGCDACRDVTLAADLGAPWSPDRWELGGDDLAGDDPGEALELPRPTPRALLDVRAFAPASRAALLRGVVMLC